MPAPAAPPTPPDLTHDPKRGSIRALRALNFFVADVQNGMGPYMALFLQASVGWNQAQIGGALAAGNIAQVLAQTPAGALIDRLRPKRTLLLVSIGLIVTAVLATAFFTTKPVVISGQALVGMAGPFFRPAWRPLRWGWWGGSASTKPRAPTKPSTRPAICLPRWRWGRRAISSACAGCST